MLIVLTWIVQITQVHDHSNKSCQAVYLLLDIISPAQAVHLVFFIQHLHIEVLGLLHTASDITT